MKSIYLHRIRVIALVVLLGFSLTGFGCRQAAQPTERIDRNLVVWGLWQETEDMQPALEAFEEQTGVEVDYRKIASVAEYERLLLEALAQGRGPDVFVIHHTWIDDKRGILSAAPSDIVDERAVREEFVDVAAEDLVREGVVFALPTSVDTLALFYNKDLLNAAGVARPPRTWDDVHQAVERITRVNRIGSIEQSGIALGTAANINRPSDIVQLLMMQSGMPIYDAQNNRIDIANDEGEKVLLFYTDFANKTKRSYSWNLEQDYSLDAFAEGETAMMVNYSYHVATIQAKNPRLNFGIAPMPQIRDTQPINFTAYWPFAVSNTSQAPNLAWQFIRTLTGPEIAAGVNQGQFTPAARREDIPTQARDPILGVYAEQALTARTWPRLDIIATDAIFNDMIDSVVTGKTDAGTALREAEDKLNQLIQQEGEI